tara:strand:+ start:508 stop:753 length:246 start_codon:yes stop_codon:yes gene_type:complete
MISSEKKAKIKWQCRRGMLELDLMLTQFIESGLDRLTEKQIHSFETLLSYNDPELYAYLMGCSELEDKDIADIVAVIRNNH